jgi:non-ribosomal peptide synthetase component F/acyl carrier protein
MVPEYSDAKRNLLEKYLRGELGAPRSSSAIPRRNPDQTIPLSYAQEQAWLHAELVPEVPLYNEPVTIHYSGELDVAALERSFNEILRRHEAWRTRFTILDGQPVQEVSSHLSISLPLVDLRNLPPHQREAAALSIATADARNPIDLRQVPLFKVRLIRLDNKEHRLYLTLSHIIFDGVAIYRVFLPELAALYKAYSSGKPSTLPELPIQYPDYTCWQRQSVRPEELTEHVTYWRKQLGPELPLLNLPTDRPRPSVQTFRGSMYPFVLKRSLADAVKRMSRAEGVTLFQTLLAGFAAVLSRYSGQDDFPIGSVTDARGRAGTEALLGYFLNTVVLRTNLSGDPTFRELLKRVRNVTLEALDHDCVSFGHLIQELSPPRDLSRNPLFQVMFSLEPPMPDVDPAWRLTQMDVDSGATKYDLYLELDERREGVLARFHYSTDLFDEATIVRMAEHWMTLLEGAASNSGLRVSELPLMRKSERHQLLVEWNDTQSEYPRDKCIHELFDAQCEHTSDAVAVRMGTEFLTFRRLLEGSNRLAQYLRSRGARRGTSIALHVERSLHMIMGLLGILKSGGAYVPLDPSYPPERLRVVLEDAESCILLTQQKLRRKLPKHRAETVCLDSDWNKIARQSAEAPSSMARPDDRAYVIYTSGSTGTPKGVEGTHRGALNRFAWMWRTYPFQAGEVCCQKTNLGFVDSIWEIFGPLLAGVPSVMMAAETVRDPEVLLNTLARERVTRIVVVPSLLHTLLQHVEANRTTSDPTKSNGAGSSHAESRGESNLALSLQARVPELKLWTCSGEVLSRELAERFQQAFPEATLLNLYGSSEVAADVTWHEVGKPEGPGPVPIGRPISNSQIYVLDEHMNPVPVGVRGEIYAGGEGLAVGYWKRPEMTAERFVANPLAPERSARLYRTGDLGRWRGNGELEYLGRVDSQVKLRGMRIELGEIEAVLASHGGVREAVVVVQGEGEQQKLAAYVVAEGEGEGGGAGLTGGELRRYLRGKLPEHMVPANYWGLEKMPLLPSGKVNRKELTRAGGVALAERAASEGGGRTGPRNEEERQLAEIWQELLEVEEVGMEQNFFELGGHSLLVLQVIARIRRIFEVELPVRSLFEAPTIAGLAGELQKARAQGLKPCTPILQRRTTAPSGSNREALLAQLEKLSAEEAQTLLKQMLDGKQPA